MPRKSPRSRRKNAPAARVPAVRRTRTTPRKRRKTTAKRASVHAPKGARPAARGRSAAARPTARRGASGTRRSTARTRVARFTPPDPARVAALLELLERSHPDATTALDFRTPLQLLIATILSAQCTDERVNKVTPGLFAAYPDAAAFARAPQEELEAAVRSTGFFRMKARAIRECCADIVSKHGGDVPHTMEELTALRGVGRKTANVVLGNAYGIPGLVVDTHVGRLANRLGLTNEKDAVKIEFALMPLIPRERWTVFSHWLILHGRRVCFARKPKCSSCTLAPQCPRIGVTAAQ